MRFKYTDTEMKILKNFAKIKTDMIVFPDRFAIVNGPLRSMAGVYKFKNPYDYEVFGVRSIERLISVIEQTKEFELENNGRYISVFDKAANAETKIATSHVIDLDEDSRVKEELLAKRFGTFEFPLEFYVSSEVIVSLKRIATVLQSERFFFESLKGKIRIVAAEKSLINTSNPHEILITGDNVITNELGDQIVHIKVDEFRVLDGDYKVQLSNSDLTKWHNELLDIDYYIGRDTEEDENESELEEMNI